MRLETDNIHRADEDVIRAAADRLDSGSLVAVPTETVYGLAADAARAEAVAQIYALKGRPAINPLIIHVADRAMADRYAHFSPLAEQLAARFWPGPLTLVLPLAENAPVSRLALAGLPTIALRVPAHPVMQQLIRRLGRGIAAPSANASGTLSPTRAGHVADSLPALDFILDGGPTTVGVESTIIAVDGGRATLLRHGGLAAADIAAITGALGVAQTGDKVAAPGMLLRHYAPRLPLVTDVTEARAGDWHIGFGAIAGDENLSAAGDLTEAAAHLFDALHRAGESGQQRIVVAPIPTDGLGAAINDRLQRASFSQRP